MAWTSPMTFVSNAVLTAAQLNSQLRDNMMETEAAKATTATAYFTSDGPNRISERKPGYARVAANETSTSTEWANLTTVGPSATRTTGTKALVFITARSYNSSSGSTRIGVDVTGATQISPDNNRSIAVATGPSGAVNSLQCVFPIWFGALEPGVNTFTLQYRVSSGTGNFLDRRIIVLPY